MIIPVVGFLIAAATGALVAAGLAGLWPLARLGRLGAPAIGALLGGGASILLQALGGGELRFVPGLGQIDWPPVGATAAAGGGCALIAGLAIALMRVGGRSRRRSGAARGGIGLRARAATARPKPHPARAPERARPPRAAGPL